MLMLVYSRLFPVSWYTTVDIIEHVYSTGLLFKHSTVVSGTSGQGFPYRGYRAYRGVR